MLHDNRFVAEIPQLRRYAHYLTRDITAAEDLLQDCLVHGISRVHLWKEGTDLRAWLATILRHRFINQARRSAVERKILGEITRNSVSIYAANQDVRLEVRDLDNALKRLPAMQREVLLQVGIEELRPMDIAKRSGVSVKTIRTRLFRGRAKLHRELAGAERASAPH